MDIFNEQVFSENFVGTSISQQDVDFSTSGLVSDSLIRLGFLAIIPRNQIIGSIGSIAAVGHKQLLTNLSDYLLK